MRRRTKRFALLIPLALVGAVIGVAGVVQNHRAQVHDFREQHAASKILGRPAADIITTHGAMYACQLGTAPSETSGGAVSRKTVEAVP